MVYYKLHDWIDESKIDWCELSGNPLAEDYLKDHPDKIIWTRFSEIIKDEQFAIDNMDKLCRWKLSLNHIKLNY